MRAFVSVVFCTMMTEAETKAAAEVVEATKVIVTGGSEDLQEDKRSISEKSEEATQAKDTMMKAMRDEFAKMAQRIEAMVKKNEALEETMQKNAMDAKKMSEEVMEEIEKLKLENMELKAEKAMSERSDEKDDKDAKARTLRGYDSRSSEKQEK